MTEMPRQIDRYPIIKSLGKGGMGEVYLAFDPICERKIAIKCIRNDLLKHKNITERFLKEAKIASQLSHPSIIPIYSIHAGEEKMYYIMPYVEGQTLKQILRETIVRQKKDLEPHPIGTSIQSLLRIFLHICHAISYSHSKGFLHRDIKPENVIVGKFGEVVLLDWGLAEKIYDHPESFDEIKRVDTTLTKLGKIVGTLSYMAPERAKGNSANYQTDIYALGVIFYQILTLQLPFKRKTLKEFQKHMDEETLQEPAEAAASRDIPVPLSQIALKCLEKDPKERYQEVDELIQDIEKYLEGRPNWILESVIDINEIKDFAFQETILLNKHSAITQIGPLSEWVILMLAKGSFPGNIKIEAKISLEENSEGLGFLFALPFCNVSEATQRGFFFWIGSKKNPSTQLFLDNVCVLENRDHYVQESSTICIEKIDSNVFISINNKPIFTYVGHIPIVGSQIGLICKDMRFSIQDWSLYLGSQNALINCLSIPDAFFAEKNFDSALYEYRKIAEAFAGKTEGREAIFRSGITLLEMSKNVTNPETLRQKSYSEFEKLEHTAGAPLEFLGKSLVYKEERDFVEEAKCLEYAIRKYHSHPLIHRLHEHIIFRLHELSNKDRHGTYLFALIVLRFSEQISKSNISPLMRLIKQYLQPLYFLHFPSSPTELEDIHILCMQLAFWLKKPMTLLEIANEKLSEILVDNIFLCLLYLDEFSFIEQMLLKYPHPLFEKTLEMRSLSIDEIAKKLLIPNQTIFCIEPIILYFLERHLTSASEKTLLAFEKFSNFPFTGKMKTHFDNLYVQSLMLNNNRQKAESILSQYPIEEIANPSSMLYPSFALVYRDKEEYHSFISKLFKENFPTLTSLIGHIFSENLTETDDWINKAFYYEKRQYDHYKNLIEKI